MTKKTKKMTKKEYNSMVDSGEIKIPKHKECKVFNPITNRLVEFFTVDENLTDIIQTLNNKGYKTFMSCEGYPNELYFDLFIIFNDEYNFNVPIPDKFEMQYHRGFNKNCRLSLNDLDYKKFLELYPNIEYRNQLKEYGIRSLKEWVERLDDISDKA